MGRKFVFTPAQTEYVERNLDLDTASLVKNTGLSEKAVVALVANLKSNTIQPIAVLTNSSSPPPAPSGPKNPAVVMTAGMSQDVDDFAKQPIGRVDDGVEFFEPNPKLKGVTYPS